MDRDEFYFFALVVAGGAVLAWFVYWLLAA